MEGSWGGGSRACQGAVVTQREARALGTEVSALLSLLHQDVDAAYMSRMDLTGKVGTLTEELDFLNHLYEMVRRPMDGDNYIYV